MRTNNNVSGWLFSDWIDSVISKSFSMAADEAYDYSYEPVTEQPSSEVPANMGVLIMVSVSTIVIVALSLAHIVICVGVPKVRADPSKWLQLLVVTNILLSVLINLAHGYGQHTGLHVIWTVPGVCKVVAPLIMALGPLLSTGLILVSLERLVTLWKEETTGSAFSQRATAILLAVTIGVALVLGYGIIYGVGDVHTITYHGANYCTIGPGGLPFFMVVVQIEGLILLILTAFLISRLCKTRCCDGGNYPLDKVVPVIVGNVLYVISDGLKIAIGDIRIVPWIYMMMVIILLLAWLLGEGDLRRALMKTCFPCCLSGEDEEKKPILLKWCDILEEI